MENVKQHKGAYKELIGRCMFKFTRKWAVLPSEWNQNKYFLMFGKYLTQKQIWFIREHWDLIDCLEINLETGKRELYLYDIKTKNEPKKKRLLSPRIKPALAEIYEKAIEYGFMVKSVYVFLKDNWDYDVEVFDI